MNNPINAISDEINSVTTEEERNHFRDKPDVHEGETPAEEKWRKYKTQTEKAEIKERRDRQRALKKLIRKTARNEERQARRENLRRDMTTDSQAMSSNTAIDGAGVSTTTLGTAVVSGTVEGAATTASTPIVASAVAVPVGVAAGAIITSGTAHASSEHAVEIHSNSKSTENTELKNKIRKMDHAPRQMEIDDDDDIALDPDQNMNEIQVDHIPDLFNFVTPTANFRSSGEFYKNIPSEHIKRYVERYYNREAVYLHSLNNDKDKDIPEEYGYLRNNIARFREGAIDAKVAAEKAIEKLTQAFVNTSANGIAFQVNREHALVKYAEKVFVTEDNHLLRIIAFRLKEILTRVHEYFEGNYDICIATARNNIAYRIPDHCPTAFTLVEDKEKRVIIMADRFQETNDIAEFMELPDYTIESPDCTIAETILHEVSHQAIGSSDFIISPTRVTAGNALDFMEVINEALSPTPTNPHEEFQREYIDLDPDFFDAYKNYVGIQTVTPAQFLKKLKQDPILKANVIIDNADFIPKIITDIAAGETYPEVSVRALRRKS